MKKTNPSADAPRTRPSPSYTFTVEHEETGDRKTIEFDEIDVLAPDPTIKGNDAPLVCTQANGTKLTVQSLGKTVAPIWLFSEHGCLVRVVRIDLPEEYASREYCLRSWPCHILYKKTACPVVVRPSERDVITFSDGQQRHSEWEINVYRCDPALRGTDLLIEEIEEDHGTFTLDELKRIRAIAVRGPAQSTESPLRTIATKIMDELKITRPQAREIVLAMVTLNATAADRARSEKIILKEARIKTRIVSAFSARSGYKSEYPDFRKRYIKNTGTRKGLYYLKLS